MTPNQIDTEVIFKLGQLYEITIRLFTTDEESDKEIIKNAMNMVLCDIGINVREICKELKINPFDMNLVLIKRDNFNEEECEIINCAFLQKKHTKL